MSSWISINRIKRQDFVTLSDYFIVNYNQIKDYLFSEYSFLDDIEEFPSIKQLRRYVVEQKENENDEVYYDRAMFMLDQIRSIVDEYSIISKISSKEREYLSNHKNYEEMFFLKRQHNFEKSLIELFEDRINVNPYFYASVPLTEDDLIKINSVLGTSIKYDKDYVYQLFIG